MSPNTLRDAIDNPDVSRLQGKMMQSVSSFKATLVIKEEKKKHTEEIKHIQIVLISPLFTVTFPAMFANDNNNNHCSRIMLWLLSQNSCSPGSKALPKLHRALIF